VRRACTETNNFTLDRAKSDCGNFFDWLVLVELQQYALVGEAKARCRTAWNLGYVWKTLNLECLHVFQGIYLPTDAQHQPLANLYNFFYFYSFLADPYCLVNAQDHAVGFIRGLGAELHNGFILLDAFRIVVCILL